MSDLQFCGDSLGKSEAWALIPKCQFVDLALILWNQKSNSANFAKFQNLSLPRTYFKMCWKVDNKQTKICSKRFFISIAEFSADGFWPIFSLKISSEIYFKIWPKIFNLHLLTFIRFAGNFFLKFPFILCNMILQYDTEDKVCSH